MAGQNRLHKLLEPFRIGNLELRNRIVMPAMGTHFGSEEGYVTQRLVDHYAERARGGAGLVIVEVTRVSTLGGGWVTRLRIDGDEFIEGLQRLSKGIHDGGARAIIQLMHPGGSITGGVAPSAVPIKPGATPPRELTRDEIAGLVDSFVMAASNARRAGFDGVELHAAHGYLISQFLSPLINKRTDEYGGNLEGRVRFGAEIIRGIKAKVGSEFVVGCRISGDEFVEGGITLDMAAENARLLVKAGADYISVSAGGWSTRLPYALPPMFFRNGFLVYLADAVRRVAGAPVITVGRINDPRFAEKILEEGSADLIAMGRALIADPELPRKAAEGRFAEIRPCIACNVGCVDRIAYGENMYLKCTVNPAVGTPEFGRLQRTRKPRKVLVIGGGPAGMAAATAAALKGHDVSLWEKGDRLGGQMWIAAMPPGKQEINRLIEYMWIETARAGCKIMLGKKADIDSIAAARPDVVVLACGSVPLIPPIPGREGENVVTARGVLSGRMAGVGHNVVVVGGGEVGCETAAYLAEAGKKVVILEMLPRMASDMGPLARVMLMTSLRDCGIDMITQAKVKDLRDGVLFDVNGTERRLECDTVVMATGARPDTELTVEALAGVAGEVFRIGDAEKVGKILDAVESGWKIALVLDERHTRK